MAFTANTAFEPRVTNGRFEDLANITGKFQSNSADADCSAGWLCKRNGRLSCAGFSGVYNENAWTMNAAASTDTVDTPIYACNTYESNFVSDGVNQYHVGHRTLGLGVPAGKYGAFTRIEFDNESIYRFGTGNLTTSLSTNTICTIDGGQLKPAAAAPSTAGSVYFKVLATGTFTEGTSTSFGYVDVQACRVTA